MYLSSDQGSMKHVLLRKSGGLANVSAKPAVHHPSAESISDVEQTTMLAFPHAGTRMDRLDPARGIADEMWWQSVRPNMPHEVLESFPTSRHETPTISKTPYPNISVIRLDPAREFTEETWWQDALVAEVTELPVALDAALSPTRAETEQVQPSVWDEPLHDLEQSGLVEEERAMENQRHAPQPELGDAFFESAEQQPDATPTLTPIPVSTPASEVIGRRLPHWLSPSGMLGRLRRVFFQYDLKGVVGIFQFRQKASVSSASPDLQHGPASFDETPQDAACEVKAVVAETHPVEPPSILDAPPLEAVAAIGCATIEKSAVDSQVIELAVVQSAIESPPVGSQAVDVPIIESAVVQGPFLQGIAVESPSTESPVGERAVLVTTNECSADELSENSSDILSMPAMPDDASVASAAKAWFGLNELAPVFLFAGEMSYPAGVDILIDALITVCQGNQHAQFILVGDGPLKSDMEGQIWRAGLADRCRFTGDLVPAEFEKSLVACDFVVIPSREGQDSSLSAQALSLGKPVLTTHRAQLEGIVHGYNGLVAYDCANSLVWGLRELLGDQCIFRRRSYPASGERPDAQRRDLLALKAITDEQRLLMSSRKASAESARERRR